MQFYNRKLVDICRRIFIRKKYEKPSLCWVVGCYRTFQQSCLYM